MIKDGIILGITYMGTLVGAGFASGQEIMNFFTIYGINGLFGLGISCFLFFCLGYKILSEAVKKQTSSSKALLKPVLKSFTPYFELVVNIYLLLGFYIMIAGCSAVLEEGLNIPYHYATTITGTICLLLLDKNIQGLTLANTILIPLMSILIIALAIKTKSVSSLNPASKKGSWLISSLIYVGYNILLGFAVLASMGNYTKNKKSPIIAALVASIGLFIIGGLLWQMTSSYFYEIQDVQIPLMYVAQKINTLYYHLSILILLCAMLTTALANGFAFAQGLSQSFSIQYKYIIFFLVLGLPLTSYGFSPLIRTIYPLFGKLGIIFIGIVFIRRFLNNGIE